MDKLRIGVLGLRRGLSHLRSFLAVDNAEVVGACDRFPHYRHQAEKMVKEAGSKTRILTEYDDLLQLDLNAVVIASNGKVQVEHACQALEAGYHVLSEVPGADTEDDLIRLREVVERTGQTYMFGENSCYSHFATYWRKWILENRFGHISIAEAEYLHYLPQTLYTPDGLRLSPSESTGSDAENTKPIWRADQPPIQYLTHDLGPLLEVLDDRVVTVTCLSAPWRQKEAPLRSDGQIALFHTAKGILIKIMVTLNTQRPSEHRYRLFGTEGSTEMFHYENCTRTIDGHTGGWKVYPVNRSAAEIDRADNHGGTDIALARHFTSTILEGQPSPIDVYRAIEYTLPGILAARSADLGGTPIPIPDMRREPFSGTHFWDTIEIPESDPPNSQYARPI